MHKLIRAITRPSDNQVVRYDGTLPEALEIRKGEIYFTMKDVDGAYQRGFIDHVNREFLRRVLAEYEHNPEVVEQILAYRSRIKNGMKPGQDLFIRMQELGLKHHVGLNGKGEPLSLDISGYELPEIDFSDSLIAGDFIMNYAVVRGSVDQKRAQIGRSMSQYRARIGGCVYQMDAEIDGNLSQSSAEIGGVLNQSATLVGGRVDQRDMKVGRLLDQRSMKVGDVLQQQGMKVEGEVHQEGAEIRGEKIPKKKKSFWDRFKRPAYEYIP